MLIYLKNLYKFTVQIIFKLIYGEIRVASNIEIDQSLNVNKIKIDEISYNIFKIKKSRLFTTSVHDQSIIVDNKLISGPSFQLRVKEGDKLFARNNADIKENISLKIGTPRFRKKLKGKVFSLLSGGAAKTNYFHWLFEILPKLEIVKRFESLKNFDYFLLPSTRMKHHLETFELLNISKKKLLDSNSFKHITCDEITVVDHPFRITNNTVHDTQNIPTWIFNWLRKEFLKHKSKNNFPKKIFIDRPESISKYRRFDNHKEVYDIFKKFNYEFIQPEKYSVRDQINMYNSAEEIAGLHGAGFANICFCEPNTKIIEFKTAGTGMNTGNIAIKNNLDYRGIICEAIGDFGVQQGQLIVPMENVKKIFNI